MNKEELNKILLKDKPSKWLYEWIEDGTMQKMISEMMLLKGFDQHTKYHDKDVLDHTMAVLDAIEPKLNLRIAALLHDISKPECFTIDEKGTGHFYGHHIKSAEKSVEILQRLGYDEELIEDVKILIRYHYLKDMKLSEKRIKQFIEEVTVDRLDDMFSLNIADIKGKANADDFESVENIRKRCMEITKNL